MASSIGQGKYEIREELGRGGMGVVYKGVQKSLDRPVAIKMLSRQLADNDEFVHRFRQEAIVIAKLNHPNIIRVFDIEESDETFYIIMEFLEGDTLQKRLARGGRLEAAPALQIASQVSRALHYAHNMGIVHRDIKPDNIMLLPPNDQPKVMDFGIARFAGSTQKTQTGVSMGTPKYMSPEQAAGREVDGCSDQYSLGVVMYGMLTGYLPFDGDSPIQIAIQHIQNDPPRPSTYYPDLDPKLEEIILKTLMKSPAERFANCDALAQRLEGYLKANEFESYYKRMMNGEKPLPGATRLAISRKSAPEDVPPGGTMAVDTSTAHAAPATNMSQTPPQLPQAQPQAPAAPPAAEKSKRKKIKPRKARRRIRWGAIFGTLLLLVITGGLVATAGLIGYVRFVQQKSLASYAAPYIEKYPFLSYIIEEDKADEESGKSDTETDADLASSGKGKDGGEGKGDSGETVDINITPPDKGDGGEEERLNKSQLIQVDRIIKKMGKNQHRSAQKELDELLKEFPRHKKLLAIQAAIEAFNELRSAGLKATITRKYEAACEYPEIWPAAMEYATFIYSQDRWNIGRARELVQSAKQNFPKDDPNFHNEYNNLLSLERQIDEEIDGKK
ncbi:serine/threonine protein kinase [Candidatus Sumerlaeota bacterium]|nr:serine/threonine protein kinase [Candidatus Sumerlaeota bacterium]